VQNTDYAAFAARVIRAHGRRIADGDVEGLAELLALGGRDGFSPNPGRAGTASDALTRRSRELVVAERLAD
jgi:hypothetical protein